MSINNVTISGNLTRDAELRETASTSILTFSVAVNDRVQENGEWKDRPNFIDCTVFGARAKSLAKRLEKGSKVLVAGKLHWSQWEKHGQKRSKVEVWVSDCECMKKAEAPSEPAAYDEDIPF